LFLVRLDRVSVMKISEIRVGRYPPALYMKASRPLMDVVRGMAEKWVRHCPLVDADGRLVGMVSIRDVVNFLGGGSLYDRYASGGLYRALLDVEASELSYKPPYVTLDDDFSEVVEIMLERRVGALAVVDGDMVLRGVISERHIMALFADTETFVKVRELMSTPLIYLPPESTVLEGQRVMTRHKIRRVPLLSGAAVKGIVTVKDVVRHYADPSTLDLLERGEDEKVHSTPLSYIASKPVVTVDPHVDVGQAISIMRRHGIGSLVVVEDERPVGMFTERDVVTKLPRIKGVEIFVDEAEKRIVASRVSF